MREERGGMRENRKCMRERGTREGGQKKGGKKSAEEKGWRGRNKKEVWE